MYRCEHRPNLGVALYGRRHWIAICLAAHKFAYWSWPFCLNFLYFSQTAGDSCWLRALSQLSTTRCFLRFQMNFVEFDKSKVVGRLAIFVIFVRCVIGRKSRDLGSLVSGRSRDFLRGRNRISTLIMRWGEWPVLISCTRMQIRCVTSLAAIGQWAGSFSLGAKFENFSIPLRGPWRWWWQHFPHVCSNRVPAAINRLCVSGWVSRRRRESITERVNWKNYRHVQMSSDKASGSTTWTVYLKSTNHSLPPICFRIFYSINSHQVWF